MLIEYHNSNFGCRFIGLIFGVIAALFPARQAARLEIVRALRYE